jgi:chromosome segregation protein
MSPEGAVGAARGHLSALRSALTRDRRELEGLTGRLDALESQEVSARAEITRLNEEIKSLDIETGSLQENYDKHARRRSLDQEAWERAGSLLEGARTNVATSEARLEALRESLEASGSDLRDHLASSPRALGDLLTLLDVPAGLERAIDAALGRWSGAVALEDMEAVREVVDGAKASGRGGVPVVAAMSDLTAPARNASGYPGVVPLVDRLGPSPDQVADLAVRLLGDVVLADDWSVGWDLVARHPALRAVTATGDLITVAGVHIGDAVASGRLEGAENALSDARTSLARAESIHIAAKRDFEKSRERERRALEELESAEVALAGRTEALARISVAAESVREDRELLTQRRNLLAEAIAEAEERIPVLEARIHSLKGEEVARLAVWEELEAKRDLVATELERARAEWHEAATRARAVTERRNLLEERASNVVAELGRIAGDDGPGPDPSSLRKLGGLARDGVTRVEQAITTLRERQHALREEHRLSTAELAAARSEQERLRQSISEAKDRLSELEVHLTELRMRRESVTETVRRDAGASAGEAVAAARPDAPDDADLEELLESRAAALRRLGPINPLADEEYQALEERHAFIVEQMEDVDSSRRELRKVISALEEEIVSRFQDAFREVADAYQGYLTALFPGGRGEISVVDREDPHSGVIIEAQPLGKKVSQMSLLSGGERSLVALAFLFAVFDARPSPFYVLDEVEAALDDANLRRFLRIVDQFRDRAQLIIVTHQQQTMQAADVLYGVTMEPGGSSQAVCKDMTGVGADRVA